MIAVFKWTSMANSPGMHPLPDEVKDYFSAATDAAEAVWCTAGHEAAKLEGCRGSKDGGTSSRRNKDVKKSD
jgi:hypothetical protein